MSDQDRLTRVIDEWQDVVSLWGVTLDFESDHLARYLVESGVMQDARAEGWDEGWDAHCPDPSRHALRKQNPHRREDGNGE